MHSPARTEQSNHRGKQMNHSPERRSLELTADQWRRLEALARQFQATAPTGPNAGEPSWRTLIKRIAEGQIHLSEQQQPD
jgi:hypothetical protein